VAAHNNPRIRGVKYTPWCKCGRERPARAGIGKGVEDDSQGRPSGKKGIQDHRESIKTGFRKASQENYPQIRSAPNSRELWDARTALPQVCSKRRYGSPVKLYIPPSCQIRGTNGLSGSPETDPLCNVSRVSMRTLNLRYSLSGSALAQARS
jgi:hypothetical protein